MLHGESTSVLSQHCSHIELRGTPPISFRRNGTPCHSFVFPTLFAMRQGLCSSKESVPPAKNKSKAIDLGPLPALNTAYHRAGSEAPKCMYWIMYLRAVFIATPPHIVVETTPSSIRQDTGHASIPLPQHLQGISGKNTRSQGVSDIYSGRYALASNFHIARPV